MWSVSEKKRKNTDDGEREKWAIGREEEMSRSTKQRQGNDSVRDSKRKKKTLSQGPFFRLQSVCPVVHTHTHTHHTPPPANYLTKQSSSAEPRRPVSAATSKKPTR